MKRLYRTLGLIAGLIVTALFIVYVVRSLRGHDLSVYATPRAGIGIVIAALFWSTSTPLLALAWRGMLSGLDTHRTWRELTGIIGITQFAKYVPGNVAQYVGRAGMSLTRGIPARPLAVTIILETLLVVAAAIVIGVGSGVLSDVGSQVVQHHGAQLLLIASLVVLVGIGLFALRLMLPPILQRFAPSYASLLHGNLLPTQGTMLQAFVLYCLIYCAAGAGLIFLVHFLLPSAPRDYWLLIAALALAWIVGFVTPGAPAGLGVREGLLLLMLTPIYSGAAASIVVIALRIATTLGDVIDLAIGLLFLPRRPEASHTSPTSP